MTVGRYERSTQNGEEYIVRRAIEELAYALNTDGDIRRAIGYAEAAAEAAALWDDRGEHLADQAHLTRAMAGSNAGPGYGMHRAVFEYIRSAAENIVAAERFDAA